MVDVSGRDEIIKRKILCEISDIEKFISGMNEDDFYTDVKTQKAVAMSLINIGELSKALSDAYTNSKKNVPWKKVQAMRNVVAHKYESVDMQIVWNTIQISVAELKKELALDN